MCMFTLTLHLFIYLFLNRILYDYQTIRTTFVISFYYAYIKWKVKVTHSVRLCNPMDYSLPGSSVHGILQARVLLWVTISFSRGYSWLGDQTKVSWFASRFLSTEPLWNPICLYKPADLYCLTLISDEQIYL